MTKISDRCSRTRIFLCLVFVLSMLTAPPRAVAFDDASFRTGAGVFVHSGGNYSPLAETTLSIGRWSWNASVSGYSESKTKVTHLLSGVQYGIPLVASKSLVAEFGLGALMAETKAEGKSERMVNYAFPIGVNWTIGKLSAVRLDANWRSWIFSPMPAIPVAVLLSHDRLATASLSLGVSL